MSMRPLIVVALALVPVVSHAQGLSDQAVNEAIKAGQSKKYDHLISDCVAMPGFSEGMFATGISPTGAYNVTVATNAGRIAFMAAEAKRLYKPFSAGDVTDAMRAPGVFVWVDPHQPKRSSSSTSVASP